MKILDRYILKKFLFTFLLSLGIIIMITLLIDFTEKSYIYNRHNLNAREIAGYYCAFLPFMANLVTPIIVFITTVWVTTLLSQRSEIIAMLSSGISFARISFSYFIGASIITIFNFYLTGWLLADANKHRVNFELQYIEEWFQNDTKNLSIKVGESSYLYIMEYKPYLNTGLGITLDLVKDNQLVQRLSAKKMCWIQHEKKWQFIDWTRRKIGTLHDHIETGNLLEMVLDIDPEDFSINPKLRETLTIPALNKHITKLQNKGSDTVYIFMAERHIRYMSPFAVLILTLLGLVISAYKSRGGIGSRITLGFIFAFIYVILFLSAKTVAEAKGTNLILNIWMPNIVFSTLCVIFYKLVPK